MRYNGSMDNEQNIKDSLSSTPVEDESEKSVPVDLPMSKRSRLNRRLNKENRKQILFSLLGIVLLIFLIFRFAGSVIGFISDFFIGLNERKDENTDKNEQTFIQAPILNPIPEATDSASIFVSGIVQQKDVKVILFLNGDQVEEIDIRDDGAFVKRVSGLREGDNQIKAQTKTSDRKTSNYSKEYTVTYSKKGPDLEVSSPTENQEFKKGSEEITVSGKTSPDSTVTVNGFRAIVDSSGNFSYYLRLHDGDNTIIIESKNKAGLSTKKEVKVKYSP